MSTVNLEPRAPVLQETEPAPSTTPGGISAPAHVDLAPRVGSWGSPAFSRSTRTSLGGAIDSAFDPFAEEDGFVPGRGRKRPRYSLRRDEWRVVDEPDSPREREGTVDWEEAFDKEGSMEPEFEETCADVRPDHNLPISDTTKNLPNTADAPPEGPHVFIKPSAKLTGSILEKHAEQSLRQFSDATGSQSFASRKIHGQEDQAGTFRLPTDTPLLRPVPSSGLPTPSPLISNTNSPRGYVTPVPTNPQTQGIQSIPAEIRAHSVTEMRSTTHVLSPSVRYQTQTDLEGVEIVQQEQRRTTGLFPDPSITASLSDLPEHLSAKTDHEEQVGFPRSADAFNVDTIGLRMEDVDDSVQGETEKVANQFEIEPSSEGTETLESMDMETIQAKDSTVSDQAREHKPVVYSRVAGYAAADDMDEDEDELEHHAPTELERRTIQATNAFSTIEARRQRRRSFGEESIAEEDEALYDDDVVAEYESHGDYEFEAELDESEVSDEESERERGPLQRQQPEVIVLDSDSDDEPAPDQPMPTPSQPAREVRRSRQRESPEYFAVEDMALDENEETWPVEEEEMFESDQIEEDLDRDDRPFEGQFYISELPIREASVFRVQDDGEMDAEPEVRVKIEPQTEPVTYSDPVEERTEVFPQPEPEVPYQDEAYERGAPESPALDDDADFQTGRERGMQNSGASLEGFRHFKPDHQDGFGYSVEGAGSSPMEHVARMPSVSPEQQLFTPDPTQEPDFGHPLTTADGADGMEAPVDANPPSHLLPEIVVSVPAPAREFTPSAQAVQADLSGETFDADGDSPSAEPHASRDHDVQEATASDGTSKTSALPIPQLAVPDRHAHGLRSKISYFAPLATLTDHYDAFVDTISIVHETSPISRAKSGSKDCFVTIQLTDPSMTGTTLNAQIFRVNKSAIPSLIEGNAILLRNFKVQSYNHAIMLVSVESSAWAVFDGSSPDARISGPLVEYGAEERAYASGLRRWYREVGSAMVADNQLQASVERDSSAVPSEPTSPGSVSQGGRGDSAQSGRSSRRRRKSHRRVTIHELRDGTRYAEIGSPNQSSIHELRDGTAYATL